MDEAIEVIGLIDDETVADQTTQDLATATIKLAQPESCRRVAALLFDAVRAGLVALVAVDDFMNVVVNA